MKNDGKYGREEEKKNPNEIILKQNIIAQDLMVFWYFCLHLVVPELKEKTREEKK